jgi:hypothetical protein
VDALCEEKVDQEAEAQADVGVKRQWPFFEEVVENGTLPETDEGTTYAVIIMRGGDYNKTEGEAQRDCEYAVHRK